MSILDFVINIIIWFLDNTIGKLPAEFGGLSLNTFSSYITDGTSAFLTSFNFIELFLPIKLIFILLGVIIIAEIILHFGFKGIKYVINLLRGSGG